MTTQLTRVLNILSDGNWHSLPDISKALAIQARSAGSRIRDLRMSRYGKHQIEVRKTSHHRVFEYRMLSASNSSNSSVPPAPTHSVFGSMPVNITGSASYIGPPKSSAKIKFFDVQTLGVVYHPHNQCALEVVDGHPRVVAKDSNGRTLANLITTQTAL